MHVSLVNHLVGSRSDPRTTSIGQGLGIPMVATFIANFLESFDDALLPMDDDVQQPVNASFP